MNVTKINKGDDLNDSGGIKSMILSRTNSDNAIRITHSNHTDKWPEDADDILEKIRCNSIIMSEYHKSNYFILNSRLKYFRIPIIIISAFASVLNIGLQPFLEQQYISILCCLLSLVTGLIGSIEMFLQVQKKMENELINSRDFYLNAIEIFKVLSLEPDNRNGDGLKFLDAKFGVYIKMIENSNIMDKEIKDQLAPIDPKLVVKYTGNLNNAGVLVTRATHKVNKRIRQRVNHIGKKNKFTLNDFLFLRFFWGNSGSAIYDDDSTVDSEDRFMIYQDIMNKVNSKDIDPMILQKMAPILTFTEMKDSIKLEERMKIYNILHECGKFDPSVLQKIRILLIEEYFTHPRKHRERSMRKLNSYESIDNNENILGNTNEICDIENQNHQLNSLRPLHSRPRRSSTNESDTKKQEEHLFVSSPIDD